MSQTESISRKPWILVSTLKESTNEQDVERIRPQINSLIDDWQSQGRMMWSGALSDNKTGVAIFEATEDEANSVYDRYDSICSNILDYHLYQWDAMPLLSVFEK